jgi:uncharacterized LabA/DUF88 family protein
MTVKNIDQRVGVLVDVSNMYYSAKNLYNGAKVDFGKVLQDSVAGRKLIRAIAYVIKADIAEEQNFFDALERAGYEVKAKDLQIFASGAKKGDWDVGIAVDAIKLADKLDTIILVSGDGDYEPMVTYLQENKGCYVEAWSFDRTTSAKLINVVNEFHDLELDTDSYLIQPRRRGQKPAEEGEKTEKEAPAPAVETSKTPPANTRKASPEPVKEAEEERHPVAPPTMHTFFSTAVQKRDQDPEPAGS